MDPVVRKVEAVAHRGHTGRVSEVVAAAVHLFVVTIEVFFVETHIQ